MRSAIPWLLVVAAIASCLVACGGARRTTTSSRHEVAAASSTSGTALDDTVVALFEPFASAHPGNLVITVFEPDTTRVVVVRGGEGAPREIYPLGSQAKLAFALVAVQLEAEGRLDLDMPIGGLMGGLPTQAAGLTLRDLLTHHGGLVFEPPGWEPPRDYAGADLVHDLEDQPPGERTFRYSNFGYMVATQVLERHLGTPLRDEADRRLRHLLEGTAGELGFHIAEELPRAALFDEDGDAPEPRVEPYLRWSCCLLEGSVTGLAALGQRLLAMRGPEARVLTAYRALADGWGFAGMGTFQSSDGALVYNQGAMPGAYSALALDLRHRRGVAVVSATNGPATGGLLLRTLALLRVLRGDVPVPVAAPPLEPVWRMPHPPNHDAWWSVRPEAFGLEGHGILVGAPHNHSIWLRRPLPAAGTIRIQVVPLASSVDVKLDLLAPAMGLTAFGEDDVPGYRLILGGWNNTRSVLVGAPDEANVLWEARHDEGHAAGFAAGEPIEVEVRYDSQRLDLSVNHDPWLTIDRVDSASGPRFLGFGGWSASAVVREIEIESAPPSSTSGYSPALETRARPRHATPLGAGH